MCHYVTLGHYAATYDYVSQGDSLKLGAKFWHMLDINGLLVNYGISNTIVLEIP